MGIVDIVSAITESIIGIIGIIISVALFNNSKCNLQISVFTNVHNAKTNLDNSLYDLSKYNKTIEARKSKKKNKNIQEIPQDVLDSILPLTEDYLNALNYACYLYLNNKINKKDFELLFRSDIKTIVTEPTYEHFLNSGDFVQIQKAFYSMN